MPPVDPWPDDFGRVPPDPWVERPVEELALGYDTVESHGWYRNLDRTVEQLDAHLEPGDLLLDYSGGTGILADRLLEHRPDLDAGILIVDSSPKFLRLALEKFRDEPRVAFRRIRWLREERRLETLEEAVDPALLERGFDALASTNAIHLYYELEQTLRSWRRALKPGARAFVQSGNIDNPAMAAGEWIIDETVERIHEEAIEIVATDDRWSQYRERLDDEAWMAAHEELRRKIFLPVRPLDHYLEAMRGAGLEIDSVEGRTIEARVDEWYDFLRVYHEGVLGWVGGAEKVTGEPVAEPTVEDRRTIMRAAMEHVFGGPTFDACWTYVVAKNPAAAPGTGEPRGV